MTDPVPASLVKELRDQTSMGYMACKDALARSGLDLDAAAVLLRARRPVEVPIGAVETISRDGIVISRFDPRCGTYASTLVYTRETKNARPQP